MSEILDGYVKYGGVSIAVLKNSKIISSCSKQIIFFQVSRIELLSPSFCDDIASW